ncbi:MAG: ribosome maturation factor RimP [Neomegalonema sp.]|nr:ribosome maturation factor RimP [Neomegalonema sp.]
MSEGVSGGVLRRLLAKTPMDEKLVGVVTPVIEGMGFRLVRLRLMGGGGRPTLQIMAERPDGRMEVEDCADLSRALSATLDVEDPIDGEYVLEVSSPGIDRPLTRVSDFDRWRGYEAKLELRDAVDGRKRFRGLLQGVEEEAGAAVILVETSDAGVAKLPAAELGDAKLMLTDALIAESLKGGGAFADGAEVDLEEADAPDAETAEIDEEAARAAAIENEQQNTPTAEEASAPTSDDAAETDRPAAKKES